ncbi:hypothetical protein GCM10027271_09440 [Saccharopolyspora gloriosae]|uniref:Uncharacterized protein n=1 Tax=Saccharopolyspora gloriosae TaxID=455344 RepID=A0A840NQ47_9PSEU|nr:hypothetical protein [Saccharopolyspora gloriosae]MBB5072488.1 hypothetical protein [Saccharopolyspora gloriosae]
MAAALDADPGILGRWDCGLRWAKQHGQADQVYLLVTDGAAEYSTAYDGSEEAAAIISRLRTTDPREDARQVFHRP